MCSPFRSPRPQYHRDLLVGGLLPTLASVFFAGAHERVAGVALALQHLS